MKSMFWVKLPVETLNDITLCSLPDNLFRVFINILLVAGIENKNGSLPATSEIAFRLRKDPVELYKLLSDLAKHGCVKQVDDKWEIHFFKDWQNIKNNGQDNQVINYSGYLLTTHWKDKRIEILARDFYECTRCGAKKNLNVHHLDYSNLWNEEDEDLITLCSSCHSKEHGKG